MASKFKLYCLSKRGGFESFKLIAKEGLESFKLNYHTIDSNGISN
jgi:hypothetical protein